MIKLLAGATMGINDSPRVLPWADWNEWRSVYQRLFSGDASERAAGVRQCWAWRLRGGLPHAIECTAQIVSCRRFENRVEQERLELSMIVTRTVNGLVDQSQRSSHVMPISHLAKEIDLPGWLVDLRHQATHNSLPSIDVLRSAAAELLDYLRKHYWSAQAKALAATERMQDTTTLPLSTLARVSKTTATEISQSRPGLSAALLDRFAAALLRADTKATRSAAESEFKKVLSGGSPSSSRLLPLEYQRDCGHQVLRLWAQARWVFHNEEGLHNRLNAATLAQHLAATLDPHLANRKKRPSLSTVEAALSKRMKTMPSPDKEKDRERGIWNRRPSWEPASIGTIFAPPSR